MVRWLALLVMMTLPALAGAADLPCYDGTPRRPVFRWRAPATDGGAPILGYRLARGLKSGVYEAPVDLGLPLPDPLGVLSAPDGLFDPTVEWFVVLTAYNSKGESERSNEQRIQPTARVCSPPGPPLLLEVMRELDIAGRANDRAAALVRQLQEQLQPQSRTD